MTKRILIIGDLIIDKTRYVNVNRISPEAPVPTAELIDLEPEEAPGGAGFAAAFSAAQGNHTFLCSAFSPDSINLMNTYDVSTIIAENVANNITKERIVENESGYHLLRIDNDQTVKSPQVTPGTVLKLLTQLIKGSEIDACILADYKKGFFNTNCRWHEVIDYLTYHNISTILDTRMENIRHFMDNKESLNKDLWLKLNKKEAEKVKFNLYGENTSWNRSNVPRLLITQGSEGLTMISEKGCAIIKVPKEYSRKSTPDTTGCGDIFDVSFIKGMAESKNAKQAAEYAVETASKYAWIPFREKLCLV